MAESRLVQTIEDATPLELIIVNYNGILRHVHAAKLACEGGKSREMDDEIKKAQNFLYLLISSLDMSYGISNELLSIYLHADGLLMMAVSRRDYNLICEACDILGSLLDSFRLIAKSGREQELIAEASAGLA